MSLNDAVAWSADLGGGHDRRARPGGDVPDRRRGGLRSGAAHPLGAPRRRGADPRPPAGPGPELPAGRDAGRPGPGRDRDRRTGRREDPARAGAARATRSCPPCGPAGFDPATVDVVAHEPPPLRSRRRPPRPPTAGGPSRGPGSWPSGPSGRSPWVRNPRLVASYDQPELRLVRDWGAEGWVDGEREILPGVSVVPTGGHSAGHQAIVVRGGGPAGRTAGLLRRPGDAAVEREPALGDRLRRLPARLGHGQGRALPPGRRRRTGSSSSPTSAGDPVGRLVPDRDRYTFEPA